MLQVSLLLLIVSIWFPGATRLAGTDGSVSFLLALFCAAVGVASYGTLGKRVYRTEATLAMALLATAALIIMLSMLSMLHADNPTRAMRAVFAQIFGFATIPAIAAISTRPDGLAAIDRLVSAMIFMSVATACLVVLGLGSAKFADRAEGYFKHANQLGIALSAGLPLVAARLVTVRKHRMLLTGCLVAVLLGLVKSGSKTNFVVGVAGLGLFFALYATYLVVRRQRPLTVIAGVIAAPLVLQAAVFILQALNPRAHRLLMMQLSGGEAHSMVSRERLWSISIDLGLAHPFAGVGAGQPIGEIAPHSHNLFIEYFRTLGVPGAGLITIMVLLVVIFLISSVVATLRGKGKSRYATKTNVMVLGSAVCTWNYLVANQMSDSFGPSTAPFFWIPLALLIAYRSMQRSSVPQLDQGRVAYHSVAPHAAQTSGT
ncbi:O-antigen ligase family protein [Ensifer sp. MJa1]|uniref:O-antigen ligase family protein n=1 Tax=Ensifer sp. MJa1 TaxID=2919888 RepID=UPI00300A4D26